MKTDIIITAPGAEQKYTGIIKRVSRFIQEGLACFGNGSLAIEKNMAITAAFHKLGFKNTEVLFFYNFAGRDLFKVSIPSTGAYFEIII